MMKKLICTIFTMLIISFSVFAQPCLPEGITFTTQAQIDNFQINYPNCTQIEGFVSIHGDDITNLNGLNAITIIWDSLVIFNCSNLASFVGFENLTLIGGDLRIHFNNSLVTLSGLDNVIAIEGGLQISNNNSLENLTGLSSLESIIESLHIYANDNLVSLDGLNSLTEINGELVIGYDDPINMGNPSLTSLSGLNELQYTNGIISIAGNETLTTLAGLENIFPESIDVLYVCNNDSLSICDLESICNFFGNPGPYSEIIIQNNAPGCSSPEEVIEACDEICLPDGVTFSTQEEIDSFPVYYPYCSRILEDLKISGENITNLDSLYNITSVRGDLEIKNNPILTNLSGLDNLEVIEVSFYLTNNDNLQEITNLANLTFIAGELHIIHNDAIVNLTGLNNVGSIYGKIMISNNSSLTEIAGLEYLYYIISDLVIHNNDYLVDLSGISTVNTIYGNLEIIENNLLSSLTGMYELNSINGNISIQGNAALSDLSGLETLAHLGQSLEIENNNNLINLSGLDSLTSIGGNLVIGSITGDGNASLTSLTNLSNLESIGGMLIVNGNESLESLIGLNSLNPESISHLIIQNNNILSECDVLSICNYLLSPNGMVEVDNNDAGCNSQEEVMDACYTSTTENKINSQEILTIVTNPCSETLNLKIKIDEPGNVKCDLYEMSGTKVIGLLNEPIKPGTYNMEFDVSNLPAGVYLIQLQTKNKIYMKKVIKRWSI